MVSLAWETSPFMRFPEKSTYDIVHILIVVLKGISSPAYTLSSTWLSRGYGHMDSRLEKGSQKISLWNCWGLLFRVHNGRGAPLKLDTPVQVVTAMGNRHLCPTGHRVWRWVIDVFSFAFPVGTGCPSFQSLGHFHATNQTDWVLSVPQLASDQGVTPLLTKSKVPLDITGAHPAAKEGTRLN